MFWFVVLLSCALPHRPHVVGVATLPYKERRRNKREKSASITQYLCRDERTRYVHASLVDWSVKYFGRVCEHRLAHACIDTTGMRTPHIRTHINNENKHKCASIMKSNNRRLCILFSCAQCWSTLLALLVERRWGQSRRRRGNYFPRMSSYLLFRFVFNGVSKSMPNILFCRQLYRPIESKAIFMVDNRRSHTSCEQRARARVWAFVHMVNESSTESECEWNAQRLFDFNFYWDVQT